MPGRVSIPVLSGLLTGFVGLDRPIANFATAQTLTKFEPVVSDPPSGGSVSVDVRTAIDGGGSGLSATIENGDVAPVTPVTGSINVAAGTTLYLRVTAESGDAMTISGSIDVSDAAGITTALTTLARVKAFKGIKVEDDDDLLNTLIMGVSKRIQTYLRRTILQTATTAEKQSGTGKVGSPLILAEWPVFSSPVVVVRDVDSNVVATTDYVVEEATGLLIKATSGVASAWTAGVQNFEVDYTAGFSSVPEDLALAATMQAVDVWHLSKPGSGRLGLNSEILDAGGSASFRVGKWAPQVLDMIGPYRDWRRAA